ncbi:MAG: hypothetical protein U0Q12_22300 [Vicinamibacterales bacterium]
MSSPLLDLGRDLRDTSAGTSTRIPVLIGMEGSGRTAALLALRSELGPDAAQYVNFERSATTPERFLGALTRHSPFVRRVEPTGPASTPRAAFDEALQFLCTATTVTGAPAVFLVDEALEVRTFENFPGLRTVVKDTLHAFGESPNRFVLTSRYSQRARRLLRDLSERYELVEASPLSTEDVAHELSEGAFEGAATDVARAIHAFTSGRPAYVRALTSKLLQVTRQGGKDTVAALAEQLMPGGALNASCQFSYEVRLQRARGYGALKAILDVLADEEPLTLTEIAIRLHRTPGSTKDYLSWLEDVDLIASTRKKYRFADPLLRLWVRLHCRPDPPTEDEVTEEVRRYAVGCLQLAGADRAGVVRPAVERLRPSGIIEID